jgi:hypothetical protein
VTFDTRLHPTDVSVSQNLTASSSLGVILTFRRGPIVGFLRVTAQRLETILNPVPGRCETQDASVEAYLCLNRQVILPGQPINWAVPSAR